MNVADAAPSFSPIRMLEVEIGRPIADVEVRSARDGSVYTRGWALARLHDSPLGVVEIELPHGSLTAEGLASAIWAELGGAINDHLRRDGIPAVQTLQATGLPPAGTPACIEERDRVIADGPLVSVIIATRDRTDSLATCLQAVADLQYPNFEVLVIDNAPSTDSTKELLASRYADDPRFRYAKEEHPGLGWAHNCGLNKARGQIIAFTDDDVVVDRHWLSELVLGFSLGPQVGCVTGLILPVEIETPSQYWFDVHAGFNKGFRRNVFDMGPNRPADPLFTFRNMFGAGANMAYRTDALRSVGGLDASLGPGTPATNGEDLDIWYRVIEAGYQLVYQPSALVHHRHREDYAALRHQFYTYGVGFTAYLTKRVVTNPMEGLRLIGRLPAMISFARGKAHDHAAPGLRYPAELSKVEWKGRLYGPLAYVRSRRHYRRTLRQDGEAGSSAPNP